MGANLRSILPSNAIFQWKRAWTFWAWAVRAYAKSKPTSVITSESIGCVTQSKAIVAAGRQPFCIVGVAGTTSTGVIDPLPELAAIARENDCWFHVDAAYGGTLAFSEKHRSKLTGIELANSITFDPHKWMFVPFSCGATLVRDGGQVLRDSFDMSPEYLSEDRGFSDAQYDFFRYGQMGTRRFNSLKLWMCFKFMGKRGYAATTERHIELTEYFGVKARQLVGFRKNG